MFPVLQVGSIALPTTPLVLLLGVWVGAWLAEREAARLDLNGDAVARLVLVGLVAGVIGARAGYVAQHLSSYLTDPLGVLSPNPAMLALGPGLLGGSIAMLIAGQHSKLPLWRTLDALAPGLTALGVAVGVAHLASGDAFGAPARLAWSIYLWDEQRHPAQVYEIISALVVLGVWWRARGQRPFDGFTFLLVIALSAVARVFLEAFRGDSQIMLGGLRAAQVWGLIILTIGLGTMRRLSRAAGERAPATPTQAAERERRAT